MLLRMIASPCRGGDWWTRWQRSAGHRPSRRELISSARPTARKRSRPAQKFVWKSGTPTAFGIVAAPVLSSCHCGRRSHASFRGPLRPRRRPRARLLDATGPVPRATTRPRRRQPPRLRPPSTQPTAFTEPSLLGLEIPCALSELSIADTIERTSAPVSSANPPTLVSTIPAGEAPIGAVLRQHDVAAGVRVQRKSPLFLTPEPLIRYQLDSGSSMSQGAEHARVHFRSPGSRRSSATGPSDLDVDGGGGSGRARGRRAWRRGCAHAGYEAPPRSKSVRSNSLRDDCALPG